MLKFSTRGKLGFAVAASLALSTPSTVMAQTLNNLYIGGFSGQESAKSPWPIVAGVSAGTLGVGIGLGNGSAAVGVGTVSSTGHVQAIGASTGIPSTGATSNLPTECVMYPGVDVSVNC